jgi:hypothetical protein
LKLQEEQNEHHVDKQIIAFPSDNYNPGTVQGFNSNLKKLFQGQKWQWKELNSLASAPAAGPIVLILCPTALRCIAFIAEVRKLKLSGRIGKLFSRHIKVQ